MTTVPTPSARGLRPLTVVIPAHNEAGVIGRCLRPLREEAAAGTLEIIVVANGCTDRTAEVARSVCPEVRLLELEDPNKAAALNAGDEAGSHWPRVYLDADVEVTATDIRRVVATLDSPGVLCAAPRARFQVAERRWTIRKFYEAWESLPYLNDSMVGSGFYALNEEGRRRFSRFPEDLIADDQFVLRHFHPDERATATDAEFLIHPPHDIRGLLAMRTRVYRGNRQLVDRRITPVQQKSQRRSLLRLVRPGSFTALVTYVTLNLLAERRSRRPYTGWERDESGTRNGTKRIGYLTSRYPSITHTFVLREVLAARSFGLDVRTFAVKAAEPADLLSELDHQEASSTWAIRPRPLRQYVAPHVLLLARHPLPWLRQLVQVVRRGSPGIRGRVWQAFYFVEAVILAAECRRQGIRHLHAHHANVAADIAWIVTDLGQRIDGRGSWLWTLTFHGPTELAEIKGTGLPGKLRAASLVLCVADYTRAQLLPWLPPDQWSKVVIVRMGADLSRYFPPAGTRRDGPVRILCVARVDPVKGYPVLLEAARILERRGLSFELSMVGSGPGADDLVRAIERLGLCNSVRAIGAIGQDELPELYRQSDIFCLPSFSESLPVVLMEAMATALPVVATAIAGIPELVEQERSGILVPAGRPDSLADALARLIEDPSLRHDLGRAGRATVIERFDADVCGRQAAELLSSLTVPAIGRR